MGGELTKRETGRSLKRKAGKFCLQRCGTSQTVNIEGWLAHRSFCEFLGRAFESNLAERVAKNIVSAIEKLGNAGILGSEIFAHTNGLCSLA
jgi:hypothetical protein